MRMLRRLALFIALPVISALSPLLVLPALTATLGADAWSAIAVGQSVGAFGAMLLAFSWNVTGPSTVASCAPDFRSTLYGDSVVSRLLSGALAVPLAWAAASLLSPVDGVASALTAVAVTLGGALPTWYFIGTGEPLKIFVFDALPRIVAAVAASALLPVVRQAWLFPSCLLALTVLSSVLGTWFIAGLHLRAPSIRDVKHFRAHALLVLSGLISSGYTSSAITLVAVTSPASVASFAAAQRIQGFVLTALAAMTNAQQGWVSAYDASEQLQSRRRKWALLVNASAGLAAGAVVFAALPLLVEHLFSGTVTLPPEAAGLVGASVFVLALNLSLTFHVHIPNGRQRSLAAIGLVATAVSVPALIVLSRVMGTEGALIAVLVAEIVSCGGQLVLAARHRHGTPRRPRDADPTQPSNAPEEHTSDATVLVDDAALTAALVQENPRVH